MIGNAAATALRHTASAGAVVAGSFLFGSLTARSPMLASAFVIGLGCLILYLKAPQWLAWLALFTSFATLPSAIPLGKDIAGGIVIQIPEILLLLALAALSSIRRRRDPDYALAWVYGAFVIVAALTGLLAGNDPHWVIAESRTLLTMIAGFVLATLIVNCGLTQQAARTTVVVLWFSSLVVLLAATTPLAVHGRDAEIRGADGSAVVAGVRRLITATQFPALATLMALLAVAILGHVTRRNWLVFGLPAAIIVFFTFTRFSFLALLATALGALLANRTGTTSRNLLRILVPTVVAIAIGGGLLALFMELGIGGWVGDQVTAYGGRVLAGLTLGDRDTSLGYRLSENANLWVAIRDAPIFGHGFGYAYQRPVRVRGADVNITSYYAHNFYLWLLAKAGVVGVAGFALFALTPVLRAFRAASVNARAAAIVAAVLLVVSVVAPLPSDGSGAILLGMVLGAAQAFSRPAATVERACAGTNCPSSASGANSKVISPGSQ